MTTTDRYYRVLYEMLLSDEIWQSSVTELFFDLLFYSIRIDKNMVRIKGFIKRLLQNAIHSDPPFVITSLLFIGKVFENVTGAKTLMNFPEPKEEESDEEKFHDYEDEEELFKRKQENQKIQVDF
jgi:ribosome biogenesis protein MAK21